jgi:hypothetical protein
MNRVFGTLTKMSLEKGISRGVDAILTVRVFNPTQADAATLTRLIGKGAGIVTRRIHGAWDD